jgi:hypothetical protein
MRTWPAKSRMLEEQKKQKSFGSFLQKRTSFFLNLGAKSCDQGIRFFGRKA